MALALHSCALSSVSAIKELALSLSAGLFLLALESRNHSARKACYFTTTVLMTYLFKYGLESSIILPTIWYLAPLLLIALYAETSLPSAKSSLATSFRLQSYQLWNTSNIFVRAHHLALKLLANRQTTRDQHTSILYCTTNVT